MGRARPGHGPGTADRRLTDNRPLIRKHEPGWPGPAPPRTPHPPFVCLLRGQVREGPAQLRGHRAPHAVLARALLLALGAGAVDEADRLLRSAVTTGKSSWLTVARAFLFAAVGRTADAARVLAEVTTGDDRRTQVFTRAAAARINLLPEPRRAIPAPVAFLGVSGSGSKPHR